MEAKEKSFSFMESEGLIEIPFFQRPYVWKQEQWEQLYNDLVDSFNDDKREHFLGSIVLKQMPSNAGDGTHRILIDGQQRLTTFSIMVKALYDLLDIEDRSDYAKYIFRKPTKEKRPKIQHSRINRETFNQILQSDSYNSLISQEGVDKNDRLIRCYAFFTEKIGSLLNSKNFLDYVCESNLWVTINLGENEDEQKIFDSLNTAGLKLTATDVIKNAIFAKAISLNLDCEALYKSYWEGVFERDIDFWEETVTTGRIQRTRSEVLLHAFAILEGFFDPDQDTLENLSLIYKKHLDTYTANTFEELLTKLRKYAHLYRTFPIITNKTSYIFEDYEERFFQLLDIADVSTVLPLVLLLKKHFDKNRNEYKRFLYFLECVILYRWITRKTTKQYNKFFAKCARDLQKDFSFETLNRIVNEDRDFVPKNDDIKKWLRAENGDILDNKRARFILFWIELYRRNLSKNKQDVIELQNTYTLEHLMPQQFDRDEWNIGMDEDCNELIGQIGNLTLLKGSLNSSISNSCWNIKLNGDGTRKNCLKVCADLLITREILDYSDWDKEHIQNRTHRLVQDFFSVWNLQNQK